MVLTDEAQRITDEAAKAGGFCKEKHPQHPVACTLPQGHEGPHVAHSIIGAVMFTWEHKHD